MALHKKEEGEAVAVSSKETITSRETAVETPTVVENVEVKPQQVETATIPEANVQAQEVVQGAVDKDPRLSQIEKTISEDLKDVYMQMPPELQAQFKTAGENLAIEVLKMIDTDKLEPRAVLKIVKKWFKLIPTKNRIFEEQGSKIVLDKIMALASEAPETIA